MSDENPLCRLDDIAEGTSKALVSGHEALIAVKKKGNVYLYRNNCPHEDIPLNEISDDFLDLSETLIECQNHGALFTIETGECIVGPCIGEYLAPVGFEVRDGAIYLTESL